MNISFFSLLTATTTEIDSVANNLAEPIKFQDLDFKALGSEWLETLSNFGIKVIIAIVAFLIGRWLIKKLLGWVDKLMAKRNVSGVAVSLFHSLFNALLYVVLLMVIIRIFGVESTSFAAILASLGLAIGMALSGQLQNLAGGIIILVTRPFGENDFIEAQSVKGKVVDITLFHTLLRTPDNKLIFVPNGTLSSGLITNYSHEDFRRVDFTIGVEYGQDFEEAKELLLKLAKEDKRVKQTPEPIVYLSELADSSVNLSFRVWTDSELYWDVYFDFHRVIYAEFNKAGIGFPFPQLTIHKGDS